MSLLAQQRCFNHSRREAAARCVVCGRFYCRECVTEHERRVICARCLQQKTAVKTKERRLAKVLLRSGLALAGVLLLWAMFFLMAQLLLGVPDDFHEGSVWKVDYWEIE